MATQSGPASTPRTIPTGGSAIHDLMSVCRRYIDQMRGCTATRCR